MIRADAYALNHQIFPQYRAARVTHFQDKGKTINGESNKYLKLVSVGHLVILRNAETKNLQGSGLNLLNNAEILRSYLAQNDIIQNVNRT